MGAISDFQQVIDPNGLISNKADAGASGNGLLFTAESMICLREADSLPYDLAKAFVSAVLKCEVAHGLYARTPRGTSFSFDQESQDDYIGLGVIARFAGKSLAEQILTYGKTSHFTPWPKLPWVRFAYYYPTSESPGGSEAWLGRFFALIAHLHWAAGWKPNLFYRVGWFISVAFCESSQDGWILSALLAYQSHEMGWIEQMGAAIRRWRFNRSPYVGQLNIVFRQYFGWDHPISKWTWK